ncbi:MAG: di-heme oxidoredictase family protein [Arenimonas sp.]
MKTLGHFVGLSVLTLAIFAAYNLPVQAITAMIKRVAVRHQPNPQMALKAMPMSGFGAPLPNLSAEQISNFATGLDEFTNAENPQGGLGPIFNNNSCVACHSAPAVGGSSGIFVTRFGRTVNGHFDALTAVGGSLLQSDAINIAALELVPAAANTVAHRQSTPLFGLGLIEAIPDDAIIANAARQNSLGLKGLPAMMDDVVSGKSRVGRFGWKAQQATLLAFSGDAYLNEMGITNRFFPTENAPNGDVNKLLRFDLVSDPEDSVDPVTGRGDIDVVADFMRFLAPPPTLPLSASARSGSSLFRQAGCSGCHQPQMRTAPSRTPALNNVLVNLYSDLLLHDMGKLGDGIEQGMARGNEMKTAPLWGLRASAPYLHDGRAGTIDQAIQAHDGEAAKARAAYLKLNINQRKQLLDFLSSI